MRVAIVGAGGTGCYFGGLLARAGEAVTFLARGRQLDALRTDGLTVITPTERFSLPVHATDDAASVGTVDVILFCVKAYDTHAAATQALPLVGPDTVLLSVQNGIDNEERIAQTIGAAHVIGGLAGITATVTAPGVVTMVGPPGWMHIGELAGGGSARTERLQQTLRGAGIPTEILPDIRVGLWEKFMFICALSGVTSLARLPIGTVRTTPETNDLYRQTLTEAAAVARACGVPVPDDAPERWYAVTERAAANAYGSMYHDLAAGRRMELESLNGTVVRLGGTHGVPTPMNFAIYAALKPYANGAPPLP